MILGSQDSSVSIVRGIFSLHHRVHIGSEVHPTFYPMGVRGSFPGNRVAEAWR